MRAGALAQGISMTTFRPSRREADSKASADRSRGNRCVTSDVTSIRPDRTSSIALGYVWFIRRETRKLRPFCRASAAGKLVRSLPGMPDQHHARGGTGEVHRGLDRVVVAHGLERGIQPAGYGAAQDRPLAAFVDQRDVGRSASLRCLEPVGQQVGRHDRAGAREPGQLDEQEPDRAASEHPHGVADGRPGQAEGMDRDAEWLEHHRGDWSISSGTSTRHSDGHAMTSRTPPSWP